MDRQFSFQFSVYLDGSKACGESDLPAMKIIKANSCFQKFSTRRLVVKA